MNIRGHSRALRLNPQEPLAWTVHALVSEAAAKHTQGRVVHCASECVLA